MRYRRLELNGGFIQDHPHWLFTLPPIEDGYADAQIDDYGLARHGRSSYPWQPGTILRLKARFSLPEQKIKGTAGFGFWNAPFGEPTVRIPALPQAVWFFFASEPTDLPLPLTGPGRGWFAATLDASRLKAMAWIPFAPLVLLINQFPGLRKRLWPLLRSSLSIGYQPIQVQMDEWHNYELVWAKDYTSFSVDGYPLMKTPNSPKGPLGFVCWIDNQYLVARTDGRFRWGNLPTQTQQTLEVADLVISRT